MFVERYVVVGRYILLLIYAFFLNEWLTGIKCILLRIRGIRSSCLH